MLPDSRVFQQLIETWRRESNTPLEPALSSDELQTLFGTHGFRATQDVVDLYSLVGGMESGCPDNRMFELWCRERIRTENAESTWDFLWFGDWLISSHLYALKPVDEFHSAVYIDHQCDRSTPPKFLAASLYEFAECLLRDPSSMGVVL
jgi:hypothetical protein